jgi:hypothetical protein
MVHMHSVSTLPQSIKSGVSDSVDIIIIPEFTLCDYLDIEATVGQEEDEEDKEDGDKFS